MEITPYKELREKLRTGDSMVCEGKKGFSNLIRFATKRPQTHVAMIEVRKDVDRVVTLESVESKGVRTIGVSKYLNDYDNKGNPYPGEIYIIRHKDFKKHLKSNPEKLEEMLAFAIDCMGYPYSIKQVLKLAYRLLFKKTVDAILGGKRTEWICSVFVGDLYKVFGLVIPRSTKWGYLIPGDFTVGDNFEMIGRLK